MESKAKPKVMSKRKVTTCLWFDGFAEEVARFYTELILGSEIGNVFRPDPNSPPLVVEFTLAGTPFQALNGGPQFKHSEAASIVMHTEDQEETDRIWSVLTSQGGSESMCGWFKDRFGVSWQIVPRPALTLLSSSNSAAAARAMGALMKMRRIDIAALAAAYAEGESGPK